MRSVRGDQPLSGRAVFLSASVPSPEQSNTYHLVSSAFVRIEEAVLRVAGAVFNAGGTLVFGGHQSISPLIGYLCAQYQAPPLAEGQRRDMKRFEHGSTSPKVMMWQSEAFRETWAEPSRRLSEMPGVFVQWTQAVGSEHFIAAEVDIPEAPKSLRAMRRDMISSTKPIAMVAIGGMEGVEKNEFNLFRELRPGFPVYVLPSTGGAARILGQQHRNVVRSFDSEVERHVREFRRRVREQQDEERKKRGESLPGGTVEQDEEIVLPYASVAARIVEDIVDNLREGAGEGSA